MAALASLEKAVLQRSCIHGRRSMLTRMGGVQLLGYFFLEINPPLAQIFDKISVVAVKVSL